ncbi:lactonase family protein [Kribbella jiaozuonensis]|uniref:Lactonase family protein n=1 Tax=Kribbella jiaozuonensis TaxID=2575441 RepID=A0A4U3LYL5_9ACTN|nr:lactonase family protein [Kribbella jiaozuonensis]TKK83559.1 lactonase family protein [Kribbella jiaozuonensis]
MHQAATREAPEPGAPEPGSQAGTAQPGEAQASATQPGEVQPGRVQPGEVQPGVGDRTLYLGTYGDGIGIATYDDAGKITSTGSIAGIPNASFVIRSGNFLYAVNEQDAGAVTAIDISGTPRVLNRQPNKGSGPCHLANVGEYLLSANYGSGDIAVHPIAADGSLGQQTDLVKHAGSAPHAHQVVQAGEYVLAVDLGTDTIYTYILTDGKLALQHQAKVKTGAGPRHLVFHPSGNYVYVADELDSTVTVCAYDAGVLSVLESIPVAEGENYPGEVVISADGRFVYVTNRGHNSIAIFSTDGPHLELVGIPNCGGDWPRHCAFDPTGRLLFVANQKSNNITTFLVDQTTGGLTLTSDSSTPTPVCVNV